MIHAIDIGVIYEEARLARERVVVDQSVPPDVPRDYIPMCCPRVVRTNDHDEPVSFEELMHDRRMQWSPSMVDHPVSGRVWTDGWTCVRCGTAITRQSPMAHIPFVQRPSCPVHGETSLVADLRRSERFWACSTSDGNDVPTRWVGCSLTKIVTECSDTIFDAESVASSLCSGGVGEEPPDTIPDSALDGDVLAVEEAMDHGSSCGDAVDSDMVEAWPDRDPLGDVSDVDGDWPGVAPVVAHPDQSLSGAFARLQALQRTQDDIETLMTALQRIADTD